MEELETNGGNRWKWKAHFARVGGAGWKSSSCGRKRGIRRVDPSQRSASSKSVGSHISNPSPCWKGKKKKTKHPDIYNFHPPTLLPGCLCILFFPPLFHTSSSHWIWQPYIPLQPKHVDSQSRRNDEKSSIIGFFFFCYYFRRLPTTQPLLSARLMFPFKRISILISPSWKPASPPTAWAIRHK